MSISPPFKLKWRWPPPPWSGKEGVGHINILRLLHGDLVGFLYCYNLGYHMFCLLH